MNISEYKFEPGARSIIQMGEELIGHPTTAINELVKNGYDADATIAKVYLNYNKDNEKSFIIISDDGLGMETEILFGEWLQPSVSRKRIGEGKSKILKRNLLGSKGIGRLAAMALGRFLTVISKTANESNYNWLSIDRENFKEEKLLSKVSFPGGTTSHLAEIFKSEIVIEKKQGVFNEGIIGYLEKVNLKQFKEGTLIIVEVLDDSIRTIIEEEFINGDILLENMSLVRALRILITPLFLNTKIQNELLIKNLLDKKLELSLPESVFEIYFGTNLLGTDINEQFIPIEEFEILANYDYRVLGKVDGEGNVTGAYACNRLIEDSFDTNFTLAQKDVLSEEALRKRNIESIKKEFNKTPKVGEFFFDLRVYDRDPDSIDRLGKVLKISGRRPIASMLDNLIGLRISKNGFGVKPYGEEDKDWMGLGEMRVQDPSAVVGANQIIGNIFLYSPQNDALSEKTNREGFFENEAFITFKKILRAILKDVGQRRYNYRQKHGIGRKADSRNNKPDASRFLDFIKTITSDEKTLNEAKIYIDEITTTLDNLENSLTFSQRLATLGSGLELVYHELAQPITIIGSSLNLLRFPLGKVLDTNIKNEFLEEITRLRNANESLVKLKSSLEPAIGKVRKYDFKPFETFNKVCYLFTREFIDDKINVEVDPTLKDYTIKDFEYFLWIAFLNILNNAVYWLKTQELAERKIIFTKGVDGSFIISNTGPFIEIDEIENIFNYGVSHKKIKNATGLGLSYTRSLLSVNNWEIWAENHEYGPAFILKPNN